MPHEIDLITTLVAALGLALVLGLGAARLGLPPLLGYLAAGIAIGPATPGFVADMGLAQQLAEIGVILLMFGVGLHFSVSDLLRVWRIAVPGAMVQIAVATALGAGVALAWGWDLGAALVFGLALSVASTVVLLRALEARGALDSVNGRIAVGWLVVEDLVMVFVLVLLPAIALALQAGSAATPSGALGAVGMTLAKVAAFIALMLLVGRRLLPRVLLWVTRTGSRELFTLCVIAVALVVAFAAASLFGVSFALGAFFAGMMLRESPYSARAADESLPLRDAFAVLFFVSVGMLFDPRVLIEEPLRVLTVVAIVMIGKTLAAIALVLVFRYPLNTALTVGVSLAQIGEFSFILAALGLSLGLLPAQAQSLIVAGALVSIAANGASFRAIAPLQTWLQARSALARRLEARPDPLASLPASMSSEALTGHVLLVGYGRVGQNIFKSLRERGERVVVAERQRERVRDLRGAGVAAVVGDAADPAVLIQAHVARAELLLITVPDTLAARRMVEIARALRPEIRVRLLAPDAAEADRLRREGWGEVYEADAAVATAMARSSGAKGA